MEDKTRFDLNTAVEQWRETLRRSPEIRAENLAELESHLRDSVAEWQRRGLSEEEAFVLAGHRLGGPTALRQEFAKINQSRVWLHRGLWMLVGIQAWGLLAALSHLGADAVTVGGLASLGYIFPLSSPHGFAPALGLAAGFTLTYFAFLAACVAGAWWLIRRKETHLRHVADVVLHGPLWVAGFLLIPLGFILFRLAEISLLVRWFPQQPGIAAEQVSQSLTGFAESVLSTISLLLLTVVLARRYVASCRPRRANS